MTSCSRTCIEQLAKYLFLYYKANEEQQQQLLGSQQLMPQSSQPTLPPPPPQQQRKRKRDGGSVEQGKSEVERKDEMLRERIRLMTADVEL